MESGLGRARAWGIALAETTAEPRDQRQQGTKGEIPADHWPAERVNQDAGVQRGKGSRHAERPG